MSNLLEAGKIVRTYREARSLSVRKLAASLGLAPTTISLVEKGGFALSAESTAALIDILAIKPEDVSTLVDIFGASAKKKAAEWEALREAK